MPYPIQPNIVAGTITEGESFEIEAEAFRPGTEVHLEVSDLIGVEYELLNSLDWGISLHSGSILPGDIVHDGVAIGETNIDWFATPTILDQVGAYRYELRIWLLLVGGDRLPFRVFIDQEAS